MTFEEWVNGPSGFGNFTRLELFYDCPPNKLREILEEMEIAYESGWNACRDNWGGMDHEKTLECEHD